MALIRDEALDLLSEAVVFVIEQIVYYLYFAFWKAFVNLE
jgi:uncharacterized protein YjeT (DUF2065 family)